MKNLTIEKIAMIIGGALILGLIGTCIYFYTQLEKHKVVIDNQGAVIKLIVETPEVNQLLYREVQKMKERELLK